MAKKLPGLRGVRERAFLTVRGLAEKSGVSYPNISRIEHGQPATPKTAQKLADALGVGVEELVEGFSSSEISDESVRTLCEETNRRLLAAEQRALEGHPTLFDDELDEHIYALMNAVNSSPRSADNARLRTRVVEMARRTAEVLMTEAELQAARRKAEAQKLLDDSQEMIGAA